MEMPITRWKSLEWTRTTSEILHPSWPRTGYRSRELYAARQHQKVVNPTSAAQWNLMRDSPSPSVLVVLDMAARWLVAIHSETPRPPQNKGRERCAEEASSFFYISKKRRKSKLVSRKGNPSSTFIWVLMISSHHSPPELESIEGCSFGLPPLSRRLACRELPPWSDGVSDLTLCTAALPLGTSLPPLAQCLQHVSYQKKLLHFVHTFLQYRVLPKQMMCHILPVQSQIHISTSATPIDTGKTKWCHCHDRNSNFFKRPRIEKWPKQKL
jgi:hypothetical protein